MGLNLAHPGFWKIIEEFGERFSENWLPKYLVPAPAAPPAATAPAPKAAVPGGGFDETTENKENRVNAAPPAPPVEQKQ